MLKLWLLQPFLYRSMKKIFLRLAFSLFIACFLPILPTAQNPHWIWHDNHGASVPTNEVRFFRKTFLLPAKPSKALLSVAADDEAVVYINGKQVAEPKDFDRPAYDDVASQLRKGENAIAIRAKNTSGEQAAVLLLLELKSQKRNDFIVTDESWFSSDKSPTG